jgi:poly(3-hydroxybutyrate) depolymerase
MENFINEYIEREKNMSPAPFLAERIMQNINETGKQEERIFKTGLSRNIAVAASFAAVVLMGIAFGNSYQAKASNQDKLVIDDRYMEHLHIFENTKNENNG